MDKIKPVFPLREAIWYFQFRPEIENANKRHPQNPVNPVKKTKCRANPD